MRLRRSEFRGLRDVRIWRQASRTVILALSHANKSGIFQLESSGLREPERIDRLLLVVAIAVLTGSLQGYPLCLAGLRRQVDPHWQRGMSFLRMGIAELKRVAADAGAGLIAWLPVPLGELGRCFPSARPGNSRHRPGFPRWSCRHDQGCRTRRS